MVIIEHLNTYAVQVKHLSLLMNIEESVLIDIVNQMELDGESNVNEELNKQV